MTATSGLVLATAADERTQMERDDVPSEAEPDASAVQSAYGPTTSPAELVAAIHAWRRNIPAVSSLQTDIRGGRDHVRGDPAAPVVVVEYGDYQCTECAEAHTLRARVQPWLETGRLCVAFRHFPLVDAHPHALQAARAAEAAGLQGRFWEVHDALMRRVTSTAAAWIPARSRRCTP
jgi:protein-disulfide isomerase